MFRTLPADNVRVGRLSVAGRSSRVSSHFTKAWTSLRRMFASRWLPIRGRMWRRSALSMILAVPGEGLSEILCKWLGVMPRTGSVVEGASRHERARV
jgi:hypothetical protein